MKYIQVLCEGSSDVPAIREVLSRHFKLEEGMQFQIHPHAGKGKLPPRNRWLRTPDPRDRTLLGQLPAKLKHMGRQSHGQYEVAVVVLVDSDGDDCVKLKQSLRDLYDMLPTKPPHALFRIAVEETESWFLAEPAAIKAAYPQATLNELTGLKPDEICGAWERLARALGENDQGTPRKREWAERIVPHLPLQCPRSPSLATFVNGLSRLVANG